MAQASCCLSGLSAYIPKESLTVQQLAASERFLGDAQRLQDVELYDRISIASDQTLTELAVAASRQALAASSLAPEDISIVLFCHQWEDEEWSRLAPFRLHHELGLQPGTDVIECRTGNAGAMVRAVALTRALRSSGEIAGPALIVAADKINRRVMRRRFGAQIFGDAAVALVAGAGEGGARVLGSAAGEVHSRFYDLDAFTPPAEAAWIDECCGAIQRLLPQLCAASGVRREEIDIVVTSNFTPALASRVRAATGLDRAEFAMGSRPRLGHAIASDLFVNLAETLEGRTVQGVILLLSVGMGGSVHLLLLDSRPG